MRVKLIFYEFNDDNSADRYDSFANYVTGLGPWTQPSISLWIVQTDKSAETIRDESNQYISDKDSIFVTDWDPGIGWASKNIQDNSIQWLNAREGATVKEPAASAPAAAPLPAPATDIPVTTPPAQAPAPETTFQPATPASSVPDTEQTQTLSISHDPEPAAQPEIPPEQPPAAPPAL